MLDPRVPFQVPFRTAGLEGTLIGMGSIALYAGYAVIALGIVLVAFTFLRRPTTSTIVTPVTLGTPAHA